MESLKESINSIGKQQWRSLLLYVAELHDKSVHPAREPFSEPWEEIGPGYCYGPAFGHWDIVHSILDVLPSAPNHAKAQILNNLALQQDDGLVPGAIWMSNQDDGPVIPGAVRTSKDGPYWDTKSSHPSVWPFAVQAYIEKHSQDILEKCYEGLIRQLRWFEENRKAKPNGFFYGDILEHTTWESGVDEGNRFLEFQTEPLACIDATSHVFAMYDFAGKWTRILNKEPGEFESKASELREFIQNELFVEETGFFHDIWSVRDPSKRVMAFEGMWPVVVGAATPQQAERVIHENFLNPKRFFSRHPISSVALDDPLFGLRMWHGPTWNSMTYWAGRGCMRYGYPKEARSLLERAIDASSREFEKSGTIWEFYHPHGGNPEELQRKPHTEFNMPCSDYLGHNPLIAMARLYDEAKQAEKTKRDNA